VGEGERKESEEREKRERGREGTERETRQICTDLNRFVGILRGVGEYRFCRVVKVVLVGKWKDLPCPCDWSDCFFPLSSLSWLCG
jgi:hypothetical protein